MKHFTKKIKVITALIAVVILFSSCASTTYIDSYPSGADLYLNGESMGQTPYQLTDSKPMFSCTSVRMEKEDHRTFYTTICKDEEADIGAIIGGVLFFFPFIWSLKYKGTHFYRLIPTNDNDEKNDFDKLIEDQKSGNN